MIDQTQRVRVEEIEWQTLFPSVRMFAAFRMAIGPSKLFMALLLVLILWSVGYAMDALYGPCVYEAQIRQYAHLSTQEYDLWLEDLSGSQQNRMGLFALTKQFQADAFGRLIDAATQLNFGFGQLLSPHEDFGRHTVIGSLKDLTVTLPGWLWHSHRLFLLAYSLVALATCAALGGAIARIAALHATRNQPAPLTDATRYALSRWIWFFLTPAMPLILAALLALVATAFGGIFLNVPILDLVGGLAFAVPLICGFAITLILLLLAAAGPLVYPAIAIEGTDGFDAINRTFGYVLGRPWRWLFYNLVLLVYGAITYLLVGLVIALTLTVTHRCVQMWIINDAAINRLDWGFGAAQRTPLDDGLRSSQLGIWGKTVASMIWLWISLAGLLLAAYAVSFYFSANTWIYLLLRHWSDGTAFDDVFVDTDDSNAPLPAASANA